MTDPRQEDRERMATEPIRAHHSDETCPGCGARILAGQPIAEHRGEWIHAADDDAAWSCRDDFDAKVAEADTATDDRPWRACVPGTILQDDLTEERAREVAARDEANRPDDAIGHAYVEQYDPPKVCPTCGVIEGTGETL